MDLNFDTVYIDFFFAIFIIKTPPKLFFFKMLAFYSKANSHRNKHELDLQHEFEPEYTICPALKHTDTNRDGDRRTEGHTDALVAVCGESNGVCPRLRDSTRPGIGARRRFINTLR